MSKGPKFPIIKRAGSVVVKIYHVVRDSGQEVYSVAWVGPSGRETKQYAALDKAIDEAQSKANQLAAGIEEGLASRDDVMELAEARRMAGDQPLLSCMAEWKQARELVGDRVLEACRVLKDSKVVSRSITLVEAIDEFIAFKEAAGKSGTTYKAKLKSLLLGVGNLPLHSITAAKLSGWLNSIPDPVTRNDLRKRAFSLFLWARRQNYLPRNETLEIEHTERVTENATHIGVLSAATWRKILKYFHQHHRKHLPALVVAGFGGLRSDEIQGKRDDETKKRQVWEDILLDKRAYLRVTNAKTNTPAWRHVPLGDSALQWLKLCAGSGPVGEIGCMVKIRALAKDAKFELPDNCFRHSFITMDIALREDRASTAVRAGNSESEINRRYRVPMAKPEGQAWFDSTPAVVLGKKKK